MTLYLLALLLVQVLDILILTYIDHFLTQQPTRLALNIVQTNKKRSIFDQLIFTCRYFIFIISIIFRIMSLFSFSSLGSAAWTNPK